MKRTLILSFLAFTLVCSVISQTTGEKPKVVTETMYILPKRGMEDKFEAAVKAHDIKFHPDGPNKAGLRKVEYGEKANWYVWVHGPTSYAALDSPPAKESGHDADWDATVEPLVESYGETQLWQLNQDLTFGFDLLQKAKYYEVWSVKLKPGVYDRFKAICDKVKKASAALGKTSFVVFENPLHQSKGGDIGLIFSFNSYAEWGNDSGLVPEFEKQNGAGSWKKMTDEWDSIIVDYNAELRSFIR
jgi:hypothetical protein